MRVPRENITACDGNPQLLLLFLLILALTIPSNLAHSDLGVTFTLGDETPASFFLGNIPKETTGFESRTSNHKMRATLLDTTRGLASRVLHLNDMGDLHTINFIDRDDAAGICGPLECCSQPLCDLTFTAVFVYTDRPDEPIKVAVNVQLIDVNDNPPTFQDHQFSITIPETTSLDVAQGQTASRQYSLPRAMDKDSAANGVVKYQLEGHSDYFSLTSPESECYPCLRVSSVVPLDYENPRHGKFSLKLIAIDGGEIPKSGSITLNLYLTDLNDNAPIFSKSSDTIQVVENQTYNQPIYIAKATDSDSGSNSRVHYLINTQHSMIKEKFVLNSETGELFIQSRLDYEKFSERKIVLDILAYDDGRPALSATFSLTIAVIDTNDNPPEISVQKNNTIMENSKANAPAIQLLVTDADEVSQGKIKCHLENQDNLPLRLEGQTFLSVWTTEPLDYEKTPSITFNLICFDSADPPKNTTLPLTVKVGNQNDNPPVFFSSLKIPTSVYEFQINEDEKILRPVYLPVAIDMDGDSIMFSMKSKETKCPFTVKADTGAVYLKYPLDYEKSKQHEFYIYAEDLPEAGSKEPVLTSSVKVKVKVRDINDNAPELTSPSLIAVKPDTPVGCLVSQIVFKDADMDGQQEVSTKLVAQEVFPMGTRKKYFAMKENGALITLAPLDKEDNSVVALTVVATDIDASNQLSTTVTLAVVIENPGGVDTLRVARPFPGSTVVLSVKKIPSRSLKTENLRSVHIPFDVYDSSKSSYLVFDLDGRCNGSSLFRIEQNTSQIKPILTDNTVSKLSNLPTGKRLEVCIRVGDSMKPTRNAASNFFVEFDWALRISGQALWPADSADVEFDGLKNSHDDENWLTSTDTVSSGKQGSGRPFKLSLGNIIMFLLILVFSLAVGFALFAAILWAKAKRAASSTIPVARRNPSPVQSVVVAPDDADKTRRQSSKESVIWQPGNQKASLRVNEQIQLASTRPEQPSEVHFAILTSNGNTVLRDFDKPSDSSENSGGPVVAYFNLIVPPDVETQAPAQQVFPDLTTGISVNLAGDNKPPSPSPAVSCYLVM
ncbi:unnamed protein product [Mesocestoides corti]|uniref:Cadherin domain-containing protein n=2 Tax=Mesocestoides corti TaxID=53468 RepID=A0A0R3UH07_MESCO|nr:unnamed protein product [Mesocestoides corti]